MKLGFLGAGRMGRAMARNLLRAGHTVAIWNRTRGKAEGLASDGARIAESPAAAAREADIVLTMLADDAAVASAVLGDNERAAEPLMDGLAPGAIHVSMSTISAAMSKRLAEVHAKRGQRYVAAPVLGQPSQAERGELLVLAAGATDPVDACVPLFDVLGRETHRLGTTPERANVVKLAANFVLAAVFEIYGEAFALVDGYDVPSSELLSILEDSQLSAETLHYYGKRIAEGRFEPSGIRVPLGLKDVRLALQAGEGVMLPMPVGSVLRDRFLVALAQGLEDEDWSAIAHTLPHKHANGR
jgi:3-hydroxyisobutyrate dehydrogenase-like beta-hydroxyacid dehydrogenase